jgi:uncharacterized tellurite resistance protein B-like protein
MSKDEEISKLEDLDDPAFLLRRAKVRELLAKASDGSAEAVALIKEYADLTAELDRRARAEWAPATKSNEPQPNPAVPDSPMVSQ